MPVKCVTCGLLFRTSNDLDWHVREEHLKNKLPPAKDTPAAAPAPAVGGADQADRPPRADGGHEPDSTVVEPPARPWWRRLLGRRSPEPPSRQGPGEA